MLRALRSIPFLKLLTVGTVVAIMELVGAVAILQGYRPQLLILLAPVGVLTALVMLLYVLSSVTILSAYAHYIDWLPFKWRWQYFIAVALFLSNIAVKLSADINTIHPTLVASIIATDCLVLLPLLARFARLFRGTKRPLKEEDVADLHRMQEGLGYRVQLEK